VRAEVRVVVRIVVRHVVGVVVGVVVRVEVRDVVRVVVGVEVRDGPEDRHGGLRLLGGVIAILRPAHGAMHSYVGATTRNAVSAAAAEGGTVSPPGR
jgi:hypothetical protein